jgi:hypothetical protein
MIKNVMHTLYMIHDHGIVRIYTIMAPTNAQTHTHTHTHAVHAYMFRPDTCPSLGM